MTSFFFSKQMMKPKFLYCPSPLHHLATKNRRNRRCVSEIRHFNITDFNISHHPMDDVTFFLLQEGM